MHQTILHENSRTELFPATRRPCIQRVGAGPAGGTGVRQPGHTGRPSLLLHSCQHSATAHWGLHHLIWETFKNKESDALLSVTAVTGVQCLLAAAQVSLPPQGPVYMGQPCGEEVAAVV